MDRTSLLDLVKSVLGDTPVSVVALTETLKNATDQLAAAATSAGADAGALCHRLECEIYETVTTMGESLDRVSDIVARTPFGGESPFRSAAAHAARTLRRIQRAAKHPDRYRRVASASRRFLAGAALGYAAHHLLKWASRTWPVPMTWDHPHDVFTPYHLSDTSEAVARLGAPATPHWLGIPNTRLAIAATAVLANVQIYSLTGFLPAVGPTFAPECVSFPHCDDRRNTPDLTIRVCPKFDAARTARPHAYAAETRRLAREIAKAMPAAIGCRPYTYQGAGAEIERSDFNGLRIPVGVKDGSVVRIDQLMRDHVITLVDVDMYIDVPRVISLGQPVLIYTPDVDRIGEDAFASDGYRLYWSEQPDGTYSCTHEVHGGSTYTGAVWDYSPDQITVAVRSGPNPLAWHRVTASLSRYTTDENGRDAHVWVACYPQVAIPEYTLDAGMVVRTAASYDRCGQEMRRVQPERVPGSQIVYRRTTIAGIDTTIVSLLDHPGRLLLSSLGFYDLLIAARNARAAGSSPAAVMSTLVAQIGKAVVNPIDDARGFRDNPAPPGAVPPDGASLAAILVRALSYTTACENLDEWYTIRHASALDTQPGRATGRAIHNAVADLAVMFAKTPGTLDMGTRTRVVDVQSSSQPVPDDVLRIGTRVATFLANKWRKPMTDCEESNPIRHAELLPPEKRSAYLADMVRLVRDQLARFSRPECSKVFVKGEAAAVAEGLHNIVEEWILHGEWKDRSKLHPRIISTLGPAMQYALSLLVEPMTAGLSTSAAYCFGLNGDAIEARMLAVAAVAEAMEGGAIIEADGSRWDGRVSQALRGFIDTFLDEAGLLTDPLVRSAYMNTANIRASGLGIQYDVAWSRLSGERGTSCHNTFQNMCLHMTAMVLGGMTPERAYDHLEAAGLFGGDDSAVATPPELPPTAYSAALARVATCYGVALEIKVNPSRCYTFLGRVMRKATTGETVIAADSGRRVPRLHLSYAAEGSLVQRAAGKAIGIAYDRHARNCPILVRWAIAALEWAAAAGETHVGIRLATSGTSFNALADIYEAAANGPIAIADARAVLTAATADFTPAHFECEAATMGLSADRHLAVHDDARLLGAAPPLIAMRLPTASTLTFRGRAARHDASFEERTGLLAPVGLVTAAHVIQATSQRFGWLAGRLAAARDKIVVDAFCGAGGFAFNAATAAPVRAYGMAYDEPLISAISFADPDRTAARHPVVWRVRRYEDTADAITAHLASAAAAVTYFDPPWKMSPEWHTVPGEFLRRLIAAPFPGAFLYNATNEDITDLAHELHHLLPVHTIFSRVSCNYANGAVITNLKPTVDLANLAEACQLTAWHIDRTGAVTPVRPTSWVQAPSTTAAQTAAAANMADLVGQRRRAQRAAATAGKTRKTN